MPVTVNDLMTGQTVLWVTDCADCGVVFAIPERMHQERYNNGGSFSCPNGHHLSWKETEADRLKKRLKREEDAKERVLRQRDLAIQDAEHERARANGMKGALTVAKRRAAATMCPVPACHRSFSPVGMSRHISSKHPTFNPTHEHSTVGGK